MMSNNKILTVSYGTFSCTLEGFDDSIDTMKAVAEYFRGLAADDRYFGAEPRQPDAEMLARIAEREIARRVEVHPSEGSVHLRASQPDIAPSDAADVAQAPAPQAAPAAAQPPTALLLQPSQSHTIVSMSATFPAASQITQPAHAGPDVAEDDEPAPDLTLPEDDAARFFAQRPEAAVFSQAEDEPTRSGNAAPNSIADKLQRIQAVVSESGDSQAAYSEDEHAEAILDKDDADSDPVAELFSRQPDPMVEAADTTEANDGSGLTAKPGEPSGETDTTAEAEDCGQTDDGGAVEPAEEDHGDVAGSDFDFSSLLADQDASAAEAAAEMDAAPAVRARVIRVKRRDLEAALNAGLVEAAEAEGDREWDVAKGADRDRADSVGKVPNDTTAARTLAKTDAEEMELDRLMALAESQLEEPESTSRRAAFEQMRGAVAAARSDDGLDAADRADEGEYRTDLAAVVTPRRPVAGGRTDRPRDQRPAPLKLVDEQRIDMPSARIGPVRPRRVAAPLATAGKSDDSFADYAAARGAQNLPELLEAAAAFLSFVEGRDQFSRPQLMSKVRQIDSGGFTREDSLRQFGMLLRSGKIEKVEGGCFRVSEYIGFRPDGERAAG